MKNTIQHLKIPKKFMMTLLLPVLLVACESMDKGESPIIRFDFNGNIASDNYSLVGNGHTFNTGVNGQALVLDSENGYNSLSLPDSVRLDGNKDFSIQCWINTRSKDPTVFLSQKIFTSKGITAQKNAGWALYSSDGTFAWSIGSGERRINYERDNGHIMPVNDGLWHQLVITYSKNDREFSLYYDGNAKAKYQVNFEYENTNPLRIGSMDNQFDYDNLYVPDIEIGKKQLQSLVDEFNAIGLEPLKDDELIDLIVETDELFESKLKKYQKNSTFDNTVLSKVSGIKEELGVNPYTVFQVRALTNLKPVSKIYALKEGRVILNDSVARLFTENEKLYPSSFSMDELTIWNKTLSAEEVEKYYNQYKEDSPFELTENLKDLTVGVWNIWHGGIHWSKEKDGWDSRLRIVEMIKEKNIDVVLMQETYSNGDYIAAELGYYLATTSDIDYKYQGANISVLSRYPIEKIEVLEETEFNNVAVQLALSKTQKIWAMSNWYGMNNFAKVDNFNASRFKNSDSIPVLFGGDFNAVPHTDGGESPASLKLVESGFTDAYRSLYPDVEAYPGRTHQNGYRIDQLYYKGKGLKNTATEVISTWPAGFPSDHYLIVSAFELDY